jgi:uncharacterized membrane protein YdjX (TVP38/TMEM64 family)
MVSWFRWSVLLLAAILLPFLIWGGRIEAWTLAFLRSGAGRWTVAAVVAGLLASDIALPVPSSLVSTAAGSLLGFAAGAAASWAGMCLGCVVGYRLGRAGRADVSRVRAARDRYGDWILVLFRPIPVLAEASVVMAGLARVPWPRFVLLTFSSNLAVSVAYAYLGSRMAGLP